MRILTIAIALVLACGPAAAQVIVPATGAIGALVPVTINNFSGDQFYANVDGDWATYSSEPSIRYYNFVSGVDAEIPMGPSSLDIHSDISGNRLVFSRIISGVKTSIMLFDLSTPAVPPIELDPTVGSVRFLPAINGNTVAYIDFGLEASGEIVVYDLTTSTSVRLTNNIRIDQKPSVSPDGSIVTWENCDSQELNCDVWKAVKSGASWNVEIVSGTNNTEANPDTNGSIVVYDSLRAGNADIFWRPALGGPEVQLQTSTYDQNPNISGSYFTFEGASSIGEAADLFIYDITANALYQLTDTPLVREQLSDVSVLANGTIRAVWTSDEDGSNARNIKAATFSLPALTQCQGTSTPGMLGSALPIPREATITQGGGANNADTYVTPYTATQNGTITSWRAEFAGGLFANASGVPSGIQLKILRHSSANILEVVATGAVHDPRPILQARFGGSYPFFQDIDSFIDFTDAGLAVQPGDIIGLTIKSDPAVGAYYYPLVSPSGTRIVLRDEAVGGTIDLADIYTGTLGWTPALQVNLNNCTSFNFLGFFQPVDNLPAVNIVTAGQAIPVKFSLDGDQGLDIFAVGHPASSQVACNSNEPGDLIEETVTAGGSSLSYDAASDRYIYVWKTQKAWKGTCRILNVRLADGTDHLAKFRFR